jgi:hypothetical protein
MGVIWLHYLWRTTLVDKDCHDEIEERLAASELDLEGTRSVGCDGRYGRGEIDERVGAVTRTRAEVRDYMLGRNRRICSHLHIDRTA